MWLVPGKITGNLISNGSEAFLRRPPTCRIPYESRNGSSLSRKDCFGLKFLSADAANLSSRDLTCCEDFNDLNSSGKAVHWADLMITVSVS